MSEINVILHPTDFSESSSAAFGMACALARDSGARLIVLHVAAPVSTVESREAILGKRPPDAHERAWETLQRLQAEHPVVGIEIRLEVGGAATEILRVAAETGSDLIVVGSHGRSRLGSLLMGSVAEQVLRRASCPVLVVKGHAGKAEGEPVGAAAGAAFSKEVDPQC